mmetsp:Transcript_10175/g.35140  ORF Transcript_10175/g.35140 Transcript_10175/m.35140 type:complete len:272 (-) Transcript_10175:3586-4401(-)
MEPLREPPPRTARLDDSCDVLGHYFKILREFELQSLDRLGCLLELCHDRAVQDVALRLDHDLGAKAGLRGVLGDLHHHSNRPLHSRREQPRLVVQLKRGLHVPNVEPGGLRPNILQGESTHGGGPRLEPAEEDVCGLQLEVFDGHALLELELLHRAKPRLERPPGLPLYREVLSVHYAGRHLVRRDPHCVILFHHVLVAPELVVHGRSRVVCREVGDLGAELAREHGRVLGLLLQQEIDAVGNGHLALKSVANLLRLDDVRGEKHDVQSGH